MHLGEMYVKLLSIGHVAPLSFPPLKSPFPNWYKPDQTCEYHAGNRSHNIDTCLLSIQEEALAIIQSMMDNL
jgi:hypothetical protein